MKLAALDADFRQPNYDRSQLRPGLVHIGLGHFFRAHPAVYHEELLRKKGEGFFYTAINLRSEEPVRSLRAQDGYYIVDSGSDRLVVGCLKEVLHWATDEELAIERLLQAQVVTMTITEKGYFAKPGTHSLDLRDEILADLKKPTKPRTALGILAWVCSERKKLARPGFTILSCDNLQANGEVLRSVLLEYTSKAFPDVCEWIEQKVAFPSSMVDRIVPHYDEAKLRVKEAGWPVWDSQAIFTESFKQWVIEDTGSCPAWEAQFVKDVKPFEKMKLQLLNASHSWLAYNGLLLGLDTVDQAVGRLKHELQELMSKELVPALPELPGFDVQAYCAALLLRFENPKLEHRLRQIAMDSTQKIPQRWWPSFEKGRAPMLSKGLAAWCIFIQKCIRDRVEIQDPKANAIAQEISHSNDLWKSLLKLGVVKDDWSCADFEASYSKLKGFL